MTPLDMPLLPAATHDPAPIPTPDEIPDWKVDAQGALFMYCWACESWIPQAQGTAPILMSCQACNAVTAVLAAWAAADAAAEEELELEAGDSE